MNTTLQTNPIDRPHIIVIGNEKGGAGKTTSAMHLIASLLELGFEVASIDGDCRQLSLSRYMENRADTCLNKNITLPMPDHYILVESNLPNIQEKEAAEQQNFINVLRSALSKNDFVIIDTPGSNSYLSRLAHSYADTIITPINDSFVDLDVLAKVEAETLKIERPTVYSQMVWEQKMQRAKRDRGTINWVIIRNRLSNIDAKNKRNMSIVLEKLAQRIGFRIGQGFSERVIFRELFLHGLTLLDINDEVSQAINYNLNLSHLAAKQELRDFIKFLAIKKIESQLELEAAI